MTAEDAAALAERKRLARVQALRESLADLEAAAPSSPNVYIQDRPEAPERTPETATALTVSVPPAPPPPAVVGGPRPRPALRTTTTVSPSSSPPSITGEHVGAHFRLRRGDTLPPLTGQLLNPDLSACDLTDATVVLEMREMATGLVTPLPTTFMAHPATGLVQHEWLPGETDVSGAYHYWWQVTWPDHVESFPNSHPGLVLSIVR